MEVIKSQCACYQSTAPKTSITYKKNIYIYFIFRASIRVVKSASQICIPIMYVYSSEKLDAHYLAYFWFQACLVIKYKTTNSTITTYVLQNTVAFSI